MAKNLEIVYNYKITDIKQRPGGEYVIGLELRKDGGSPYRKAFRLHYTRPISLEEFEKDLKKVDLSPNSDPMQYLKEEIDKDHKLSVKI